MLAVRSEGFPHLRLILRLLEAHAVMPFQHRHRRTVEAIDATICASEVRIAVGKCFLRHPQAILRADQIA